MKTRILYTLVMALLCAALANAQPTTTLSTNSPAPPPPKPADHSYKPLTLKLNEDGSKYIRFIMWHQIWVTATQNNPGTKDVKGRLIDGSQGSVSAWSQDVALRRSRFLAYAQISPRAMILTHWGINNQSFDGGGVSAAGFQTTATTGANNGGKKPQLFIHDAWTEFEIFKDKLYMGAGLTYWNGISRMSSASTLTFMTLDAPIFNWPTIDATDQFARQLGIYAKGQLGKLDYRVALNKPFANGKTPLAVGKGVAENVLTETWSQAGYFSWMFLDKESNKLPYYAGSYLGAKRIFNIGAGFYHQKGASLYKSSDGRDSTYQDHLCIGVDAFLDIPINKEKGSALSVLATWYHNNMGTNYIRNVGILNTHTTPAPLAESWAGGGNFQPTIGTGDIFYTQAGYQLPKLKNGTAFMPYITGTYKKFDRLKDPSFQYGVGLNYFITGHNTKITLEYQTRPVYVQTLAGGDVTRSGYKGQLILQTHIFL
ncbi:MAG: porin [Bacteroidetes bacterium]|nr:porin [Bacteroidota bacterium]